MKSLLLLVLVPLVYCVKCPDVKDIENFAGNKLVGDWYVVKYTPNLFDKGYNCSTNFIHSYEDEVFNGVYRRQDVSTNSIDAANYSMTSVDGKLIKLSCDFTTVRDTINVKHLYMTATDYDNYLLYFMCIKDGDNIATAGWIEAKNKRSLSEEYMQEAMKHLQKYGIESGDFLTNDEKNCKV